MLTEWHVDTDQHSSFTDTSCTYIVVYRCFEHSGMVRCLHLFCKCKPPRHVEVAFFHVSAPSVCTALMRPALAKTARPVCSLIAGPWLSKICLSSDLICFGCLTVKHSSLEFPCSSAFVQTCHLFTGVFEHSGVVRCLHLFCKC